MRARLLALLAAFLLMPGAAVASSLTFGCGKYLCRSTAAGTHLHHLIRTGATPDTVSVSRDGHRMVFGSYETWYLTDGRARHRRLLEAPPGYGIGTGAQMSPDGGKVVFPTEREGVGADANCWRPFTRGRAHCTYDHEGFGPLAWAPGIGLVGWAGDERQIVCRYVRGRCGRALARTSGSFFDAPQLSPDGRLLAVSDYVSSDDARIELYSPRTSRRVRTLTRGHTDLHPSWSPDGHRIVFSRDAVATHQSVGLLDGRVSTVSVNGGRVRNVAHGVAPAWSR